MPKAKKFPVGRCFAVRSRSHHHQPGRGPGGRCRHVLLGPKEADRGQHHGPRVDHETILKERQGRNADMQDLRFSLPARSRSNVCDKRRRHWRCQGLTYQRIILCFFSLFLLLYICLCHFNFFFVSNCHDFKNFVTSCSNRKES